MIRLEAMAKAFEEGAPMTVNGSNINRNYDEIPDNTIYAGGVSEPLQRDNN